MDGAEVEGEIVDGPAGAGRYRQERGRALDKGSEPLDLALEKVTVLQVVHARGLCQGHRGRQRPTE